MNDTVSDYKFFLRFSSYLKSERYVFHNMSEINKYGYIATAFIKITYNEYTKKHFLEETKQE